jgi:saccharopine dehydrogenase-like NADP-dependent oxidoreductase
MTKVLIVGAHGQIARVATQLFLDRSDVELQLYLRNAKRLESLQKHPRITLVEGDATDAAALARAIVGQDVVYANLSGNLHVQATAIVTEMTRAGVKRLIFINSMGIYGEVPGETYGAVLDPEGLRQNH